MHQQTILNMEKLEDRALLNAAPVDPPPKPNPRVPSSSQAVVLKIEVVWPPKLKNPPRIVIETVLRPKVWLGVMNPNDSFWYFSKSDRKYRWNFKVDKELNKIILDDINLVQSYLLHNIDTPKNEYLQPIHSH